MVGAARLELTTLCSQSRCASQLRYAPITKASSDTQSLLAWQRFLMLPKKR
jgi:hypothetical protein